MGLGAQVNKIHSAPITVAEWLEAISVRLRRVAVLNRPWHAILKSDTLRGDTATVNFHSLGILLDPPYLNEQRSGLYESDADTERRDDPARDSYAWAVEHGERYRVAYCCHDGDFPLPDGWTKHVETLGGIRREDRRHRRDCIMFSPACVQDAQGDLFGGGDDERDG